MIPPSHASPKAIARPKDPDVPLRGTALGGGVARDYEALVILKAGGTEQEIARHAASLEEPIKKIGGSVEGNQSMGRRRLAFRIAKQAEGYYYLLRFRAPTAQVKELDRLFRLHEAVVRFIILSTDEAGPLRSAASPTRS